MKKTLPLSLIFLGILNAQQPQYPSDIDLKASYCTIYWRDLDSTLSVIPIGDGTLNTADSLNIVRMQTNADANFKKAGDYVKGREQYDDLTPLLDAMNAARRDIYARGMCVTRCDMEADSCSIWCRKKKGCAETCKTRIDSTCADFCDTKGMKECLHMSFLPY